MILKQSLSLLQTFRWDYRSHCGHGCRNPQSDPGLCPSSNSSSLSLLPWGIFNGEEPGPCRLSGCDVPPKVSAGSPGCQFALFRILQGFCLLGLLILIFWEHPSSSQLLLTPLIQAQTLSPQRELPWPPQLKCPHFII